MQKNLFLVITLSLFSYIPFNYSQNLIKYLRTLEKHKFNRKELEDHLKKTSDIDEQDSLGQTALHHAVRNGNFELVKLIITHKPNINARDRQGFTPLMFVAENQNCEECIKIVELLLKKGALVNIKNKFGQTAFHYATASGNTELSKRLFDKNANDEIEDNNGQTPKQFAREVAKYVQ